MTLADLKLYLGITDSANDDLLQSFLNAATAFVEKYIGRAIYSDSREEFFDGNGQKSIILKNYPLYNVVLSENTGTISSPVWDYISEDSYYANPINGIVKLNFTTKRGLKNYFAEYVGGMDPAPYDLQLAVLKLAGSYRNTKSNDGTVKESVGGDSIEFSVASIPPTIFGILDMYKNVL